MIDIVRSSVRRLAGPAPGPGILVAVSGGVDSMSLLHVLVSLGYDVTCIHVNHEQRVASSERDAVLVQEFCEKHQIQFATVRIGTELRECAPTGSIQGVARRLRHEHFLATAVERDISFVATGHNRDDQAETVLINLLRRTGIDGMCGMPEKRSFQDSDVVLIRPLLHIGRRSIEQYAAQNHVPWFEDESNSSYRYTRNRIRHDALRSLQSLDTSRDVVEEIIGVADAVKMLVGETFPAVLSRAGVVLNDADRLIPVDALLSLPEVVWSWLFLRSMRKWIPGAPARQSTVVTLEKLLGAPTGKRVEFKEGAVWRERDHLLFVRNTTGSRSLIESLELRVERIPADKYLPDLLSTSGGDTAVIDSAKLNGPLSLRLWQPGDRFIPLGMKGARKIKSFLTDRRVDTSARKNICVVGDNDKIVWVVGLQIDDRVKVDKQSSEILRLSIQD